MTAHNRRCTTSLRKVAALKATRLTQNDEIMSEDQCQAAKKSGDAFSKNRGSNKNTIYGMSSKLVKEQWFLPNGGKPLNITDAPEGHGLIKTNNFNAGRPAIRSTKPDFPNARGGTVA